MKLAKIAHRIRLSVLYKSFTFVVTLFSLEMFFFFYTTIHNLLLNTLDKKNYLSSFSFISLPFMFHQLF